MTYLKLPEPHGSRRSALWSVSVCSGLAFVTLPGAAQAEELSQLPPVTEAQKTDDEHNGWAARGGLEFGLLNSFKEQHAALETTNATTRFTHDPANIRATIGPRLELGYLLTFGSGAGLFSRLGAAVGFTAPGVGEHTVVGVEHHYSYRQTWWEVTTGAEFLFMRRRTGVGVDLGAAGLISTFYNLEPRELNVWTSPTLGPLARLQLTHLVPINDTWKVGASAWLSGLLAFNEIDVLLRGGIAATFSWEGRQ